MRTTPSIWTEVEIVTVFGGAPIRGDERAFAMVPKWWSQRWAG